MDMFIVLLAVGASAYFIVRRFWKSVTRSPEDSCSDGCTGCTCASGHTKGISGNDCMLSGDSPADGSKPSKCATASRK